MTSLSFPPEKNFFSSKLKLNEPILIFRSAHPFWRRLEKLEDTLKLRHLKRFELDKLRINHRIHQNHIRKMAHNIQSISGSECVGECIVEDMNNAGIPNVEGIILTMPKKGEVLS